MIRKFQEQFWGFIVIGLIPIDDYTTLFSITRSNALTLNGNYTITLNRRHQMASVLIVIKHVIGTNIVRIPDNQYKIQALFWREKRREFGAKNAAN